jgi:hypothetical protein
VLPLITDSTISQCPFFSGGLIVGKAALLIDFKFAGSIRVGDSNRLS